MREGEQDELGVGGSRPVPRAVIEDWLFRARLRADEIRQWLEAGFDDPEEAAAWRDVGVTDPLWAARFSALGAQAADIGGPPGIPEYELERWLSAGFTTAAWVRSWIGAGVDTPEVAAAWARLLLREFERQRPRHEDPGLPLEGRLEQAGIDAQEVGDWVSPAVEPEVFESLLAEAAQPEWFALLEWLEAVDVETTRSWLAAGVQTVQERERWHAADILDANEARQCLMVGSGQSQQRQNGWPTGSR